jgi:hypothetical protein
MTVAGQDDPPDAWKCPTCGFIAFGEGSMMRHGHKVRFIEMRLVPAVAGQDVEAQARALAKAALVAAFEAKHPGSGLVFLERRDVIEAAAVPIAAALRAAQAEALACQDCKEYRAMMAAKLAEAERRAQEAVAARDAAERERNEYRRCWQQMVALCEEMRGSSRSAEAQVRSAREALEDLTAEAQHYVKDELGYTRETMAEALAAARGWLSSSPVSSPEPKE